MKIFERGELKLLWPFYLDALLSTMLFFIPIYFIVYFRDFGFSLFQISILLAVPSLVSLVCEIPTGAVADLYGRKFSVLVGILLQAISVMILYFVTSYSAIVFGLAFLGFASSFMSGASDAWVTDLINSKNKNLLTKFFSKSQSIASIGLVVSGILGALLVKQFSTKIIWPTAAISFIISFIILRNGKENFVPKKTNLKNAYSEVKKQTKISLKYSWKERHIFSLILASILIAIAYAPLDIGFTPLLQDLNFPEYAFGYLWSAISLVGVVAPLITQKIIRKNKERKFILTTTIIMIIATLFIFFATTIPIAIAVILSLIFFSRMRSPVLLAYFQKFVPTKFRATIGSVKSMTLEGTTIIITPLAGFLLDNLNPRMTIFYASLVAIPAAIIYKRIKEGGKKKIFVSHTHISRKIHKTDGHH